MYTFYIPVKLMHGNLRPCHMSKFAETTSDHSGVTYLYWDTKHFVINDCWLK